MDGPSTTIFALLCSPLLSSREQSRPRTRAVRILTVEASTLLKALLITRISPLSACNRALSAAKLFKLSISNSYVLQLHAQYNIPFLAMAGRVGIHLCGLWLILFKSLTRISHHRETNKGIYRSFLQLYPPCNRILRSKVTHQVVCEQSIAKNIKKTDEGNPWRNWKIRIFGLTEAGEEYQLKFVDYVEYIMHPSFTNPRRSEYALFGLCERLGRSDKNCKPDWRIDGICSWRIEQTSGFIFQRKPPFTLQEKGWGEFDLKIVLHFPNEITEPQTIDFDLNFKQERYEVTQVLVGSSVYFIGFRCMIGQPKLALDCAFTNRTQSISQTFEESPELTQVLSLTENLPRPEPPTPTPTTSKKRRNSATKANIVMGTRGSSLDATSGKKNRKPASAYPTPAGGASGHMSDSQSPTTPSLSDVSASPDAEMGGSRVPKGVNMDLLADMLQNLEGEDLWELQRIVNENKTEEMHISEDEGQSELVMDLYTLGENLLRKLWDFTSVSMQRKKHRDG
ncbi:hypothetical protein BC938DRAFT_475272 [Jimgerdemannia flammicorona]|uniref:YEATS domain-containing protein n=1 Tax=Jimgerdemannia flammicorona TaxID=994334 RepID=A0A433QRU6_9FUNG|nr:hypothetical protein BC938DRAFT_475272 [Jimgerdemannia flammicorona]